MNVVVMNTWLREHVVILECLHFIVYRSPNFDESIYDCLVTSQIFTFIGDFNAHPQDWPNYVPPTDRHGISALNFSDVVG